MSQDDDISQSGSHYSYAIGDASQHHFFISDDDEEDARGGDTSGAPGDRLLDAGSISLKRMPLLHMIVERISANCADFMRHLAPTPMYFTVKELGGVNTTELLDGFEQNGLAGVFHVPEWDSSVVVAIDRAFIYTTIEALFGGDGSEPPTTTVRAFSSIEMRIAQNMFEGIGRAFEAAFDPVATVHLNFERIETRMDFATIGRRSNQAVAARYELSALDRTGVMCILIPQSVILSMRNALARPVVNDQVMRDPAWASHIQSEVQRANVELHAVLGECDMTLGELAGLRVGQLIRLDPGPRRGGADAEGLIPTRLCTSSHDLFWCGAGISGGQLVLKVLEPVSQENGALDDLLNR